MSPTSSISDTAFLVCESRARRTDLSLDRFARDWIPESRRKDVSTLWDDFAREVYPDDDLVVSMRNRFFLGLLTGFAQSEPDGWFLNLGAGLTSYPFLIDRDYPVVEVDLPEMSRFKAQQREWLISQGVFQSRSIDSHAADLEDATALDGLESLIRQRPQGPALVLIEGLSYYLAEHSWKELIGALTQALAPGSIVAFDYWPPELRGTEMFKRLADFFENRFAQASTNYNLLSEADVMAMPGLRLSELSSAATQALRVAGIRRLEAASALSERYAVLVKEEQQ